MKSDGKESRFESARTEVSILLTSSTLSFSFLPNCEEGEQLRRQKYALLTQWEETRCKALIRPKHDEV